MDMIRQQMAEAMRELISVGNFQPGDVFVVGISTSEVSGGQIGKQSNAEIGVALIQVIASIAKDYKLDLAVQGCEHINRALVMEREAALRHGFELVTVIPQLHAGGGGAVAWYAAARDPVVVEHIVAAGGLDIGDTFIGMHVKHVQVPVRLAIKQIGEAHLTALRSRPKLIGGQRAKYPES